MDVSDKMVILVLQLIEYFLYLKILQMVLCYGQYHIWDL